MQQNAQFNSGPTRKDIPDGKGRDCGGGERIRPTPDSVQYIRLPLPWQQSCLSAGDLSYAFPSTFACLHNSDGDAL